MLTYKYEARNTKTGEKIKAAVEADNEQSAVKLIRDQGLVPVDIKLQRSKATSRFSKVKAKDRILFSRQLSTLINAGLPLVQSLRSVSEQTTNKKFVVIINQIINDVEAGQAFSVALQKHPKVFNRIYVSLIAASEVSGTLDKGLERLADQQEKDAEIVSKVRGALMYPLIVLVVMAAVLAFMLIKVLPQVQNIYAGLPGAKLPFITQALLDLSNFLIHKWWIALIIIGLLVFFGTRAGRTVSGKKLVDTMKMRAGPLGKLFMKMYMARFARTATTLVASGVPLLQVLEITSEAVGNVNISETIEKAIEKVKGGKSLADALQGDKNFLELVPNMLRIGEQSGAMETMLEKVAEYYEKEVDNEIKAISTIIEPVMMVIMGVVAFIIVAAILLPIYGLSNNSSFTNGAGG